MKRETSNVIKCNGMKGEIKIIKTTVHMYIGRMVAKEGSTTH